MSAEDVQAKCCFDLKDHLAGSADIMNLPEVKTVVADMQACSNRIAGVIHCMGLFHNLASIAMATDDEAGSLAGDLSCKLAQAHSAVGKLRVEKQSDVEQLLRAFG